MRVTSPALQKQRHVPLRLFLSLIILVSLLPPMALLAVSIMRSGWSEQAAAEERFADNAQLIASIVESSLTANAYLIRSMGEAAVADPRAGGNASALDAIKNHFGGRVTILPKDEMPVDVAHGDWSLSNIFDVQPGVGAKVALSIPIRGETGGLISVTADASALTRNIDLSGQGNLGLLAAVVDGNGRILARSIQQSEFIGRPVPNWQALLDVGADHGVFDAESIEGEIVTFGFSKVAGTPGWAVVTGMPKAAFDARWREPLLMLILSAIVATIAALILATWLSTRITAPISALVAQAHAIMENDRTAATPIRPTRIAEFAQLQRAQTDAHTTLTERAAQLALSSQRFHAIAKVGALVTWRRDIHGNILDIEGWCELTGQTLDESDGAGWLRRLHPEDVPEVLRIWTHGRRKMAHMDFEMRVQTVSGEWVWLQTRAAPITDGNGEIIEWIGTMENIDTRKRQHLQVSHMAYHDALTGLPNRVRLDDHLGAVWADREHGAKGALLYVDLDRFKQANDTYGHAVGDELLRKVAERLQRLIRPSDLAARLGGDEFAVVLRDTGEGDLPLMIAIRIVKTLAQPFEIDGTFIEIGASVGIALVTDRAPDIAHVIWEADAALYQAKSEGRNRCAFYTPDQAQNRA